MAYATNSVSAPSPLCVLAAIKRAFESAFVAMSIAASHETRQKEIEHLQSLSDEDLTALDLKRDEIVRYVYRDLFYV